MQSIHSVFTHTPHHTKSALGSRGRDTDANSIWSHYKKGDIEAIETKESNKISNITQNVTIQRTIITIKFKYFEIQMIRWRHDRSSADDYVETICMTEVLH